MSKAAYIGVDNIARKVKKMYIGVDGVARKVKKAYIGINGVARLFYSADVFGGYTGAYTVSQVKIDSVMYDLYTLTGSGTLTLNDAAQYWMCGGGESGSEGKRYDYTSRSYIYGGLGGNGGHIQEGTLFSGNHVIIIGAGGTDEAYGGDSSIDDITAKGGGNTVDGKTGASGGGECGIISVTSSSVSKTNSMENTGAGKSTLPFGLETLLKHCPGGGGGQAGYRKADGSWQYRTGKPGGSNGSSSSGSTYNDATTIVAGGEHGGGNSQTTTKAATAGSFYGAGGGGAYGFYRATDSYQSGGSPGSGYQGVCYILIPAEAA